MTSFAQKSYYDVILLDLLSLIYLPIIEDELVNQSRGLRLLFDLAICSGDPTTTPLTSIYISPILFSALGIELDLLTALIQLGHRSTIAR